jgi:hypothetical protein
MSDNAVFIAHSGSRLRQWCNVARGAKMAIDRATDWQYTPRKVSGFDMAKLRDGSAAFNAVERSVPASKGTLGSRRPTG